MQRAVHVRPDRLRAHAAAALELSGALQAVLGGRPEEMTELDQLDTRLRRAVRELAELNAVLAAVADAAESADRDAVRAVHRAGPS